MLLTRCVCAVALLSGVTTAHARRGHFATGGTDYVLFEKWVVDAFTETASSLETADVHPTPVLKRGLLSELRKALAPDATTDAAALKSLTAGNTGAARKASKHTDTAARVGRLLLELLASRASWLHSGSAAGRGVAAHTPNNNIHAEAVRMLAARVVEDKANAEHAERMAQKYKPADDGNPGWCGKAIENRRVALTCPTTITGVEFASYGTPGGSCETGLKKTSCHAETTEAYVIQQCVGRPSCEVAADNNLFGEPCYGETKYLAIKVTCAEAKPGDFVRSDNEPLPPLDKVTVAQLEQRPDLLSGEKPFMLLDGMKGWAAVGDGPRAWNVDTILERFPEIKTNYFFTGKAKNDDIPRIVPVKFATQDYHDAAKNSERTPYMLWYVALKDWRKLQVDTEPINKWLINQELEMQKCFGEEGLASIYDFTFWRMILIGQEGTVFNMHTDNVDSATWQAQIKGRKHWTICPPSETPYLYELTQPKGSSNLNSFNVDLEKFPLWAHAKCYKVVAKPGDILYYPPKYWHHTMNLDMETIALTSRVIHPNNVHKVINQFKAECARPPATAPPGYEVPPTLNKETTCKLMDKCEAHLAETVKQMMVGELGAGSPATTEESCDSTETEEEFEGI